MFHFERGNVGAVLAGALAQARFGGETQKPAEVLRSDMGDARSKHVTVHALARAVFELLRPR